MHGGDGVAAGLHPLGDAVGVALGAGEDDDAPEVEFQEEGHEEVVLLVGIDRIQAVVDGVGGGAAGAHVHADRVGERPLRDARDGFVGGGGEEEGLALLRQMGGIPGATTCIFSGTFGRTYDLGPVLSVAPRFRDGAKLLQFVLCGDGERRNEWRSRAAGIGNVIFTGWLDQDRMRRMLAASDIGLAAYAKGAPQGIPNKVIEYLAAGLPVASALQGETEALLRDEGCGETYDPDDVNSLQHVLTSLADERHGERSAIALKLFGKRFRAEAVYGAYADHLEALANSVNGHAVGGLHTVGRGV